MLVLQNQHVANVKLFHNYAEFCYKLISTILRTHIALSQSFTSLCYCYISASLKRSQGTFFKHVLYVRLYAALWKRKQKKTVVHIVLLRSAGKTVKRNSVVKLNKTNVK